MAADKQQMANVASYVISISELLKNGVQELQEDRLDVRRQQTLQPAAGFI